MGSRIFSYLMGTVWCITSVHTSTNLALRGNTVTGETFQLVCSSTPNDQGLTTFSIFRSSSSGSIGTNLGTFGFSPSNSPACHDRGIDPFSYPFGCEAGGRKGYINITVPTDNVNSLTEHNTYWRCATLTARATAENNVVHVSIIVPITGISLISPAVGIDNTVILTENVPTTFQCRTTQGRPTANVTWYLDNVLQSGGTTSSAPVTGDIVITTGTLTLTVDRTADGKVLSCRGTNYVNMVPVQSTRNPVLKMKYAPSGTPAIVGHTAGSVYKTILGRPQSLTCRVPTTYPVPTLSWSCPSYTVTGTTPLPGATDVISSTITWTATSTGPGQTCQCRSDQEISGLVTTHISIDVLYPPSPPTYQLDLSGTRTDVSGSAITLIEGDRLVCNTVSNPAPSSNQYRWSRSSGDSWTHTGQTLPLTRTSTSSGTVYTCEVTNTMVPTSGASSTGRNSSDITVSVLYPPSPPTYHVEIPGASTAVTGSIDVVQGDTVRLTCNTVSNPPPASDQYGWTRSTGGSWTHGQQVLTLSNIQPSSEATYTCEVTNTMTRTGMGSRNGHNSSIIDIHVLYPPTTVTLTYRCETNPMSILVIRNTVHDVRCQSNGNPAPSLHWNGEGQTVNTGILPLNNLQTGGTYRCNAPNVMTRRPGGRAETGTMSGSLDISLLYGPDIEVLPQQEIVEGSLLNITCSANSNPAVSTYYWSRPGSTGRDILGPVLTVPTVLRSHAGTYTCHAENSMTPTCEQTTSGRDMEEMVLVVQYFPTVTGSSDMVTNRTTVTLSCTAEGIPASYTFYNWSHVAPDNRTELRSLFGTSNGASSTLTLSGVDYEDSGYYRCSVSNGVRDYINGETVATKNIKFTFQSKPVVTRAPDVAGRIHDNATLVVDIFSNEGSPPKIRWYRSADSVVINTTIHRYTMSLNMSDISLLMYEKHVTLPGYTAILTINSILLSDFTSYRLEIMNDFGSTQMDLILRQEGPPYPPTVLGTTQTTSTITISWRAGFHGGADQTFQVDYRKSGASEFEIGPIVFGGMRNTIFNATLENLSSSTSYDIRLSASNEFGTTTVRDLTIALTYQEFTQTCVCGQTSLVGPVLGSAVGGAGLAIVVVLGTIYMRQYLQEKGDKNRSPSRMEDHTTIGQETPVYLNLEPSRSTSRAEGLYQDLSPNRSAPDSHYQALNVTAK